MRALINALIIHFTLNILVFLKGWHTFDKTKWVRWILIVVFGVELLIYSAGFIFFRQLPENIVQMTRVLGTSWMLFLLYVGGLWLIIDLIYIAVMRFRKKSWRYRELTHRYKIITFIVPVIMVTGILLHGHHKFNNPVVQQIPIVINKDAKGYDSLRVAVIADLHLGWMINRSHAKRFVDLIMAQDPDLILFVGDILDSHIEPVLEHNVDIELKRLSAPLGVYSCPGNHEYRFEAEEKIQFLEDAGITMLIDSAVLIDSAFYVIGRDDMIILDRKPIAEIMEDQNIDHSMPIIVLNHTPDNLDEEVEAGADIALYGHTHHGQAFPGNIATEIIFEVAHGYKKKEDTHIYVTSGIGLVGPQFRVGTVSEMVMLNVKFQKEGS